MSFKDMREWFGDLPGDEKVLAVGLGLVLLMAAILVAWIPVAIFNEIRDDNGTIEFEMFDGNASFEIDRTLIYDGYKHGCLMWDLDGDNWTVAITTNDEHHEMTIYTETNLTGDGEVCLENLGGHYKEKYISATYEGATETVRPSDRATRDFMEGWA